jgi:hypothetical protein
VLGFPTRLANAFGHLCGRRPLTAALALLASTPALSSTPDTLMLRCDAVPTAPIVNQHKVTTKAKRGIRFPTTYVAALAVSPILKTSHSALANQNLWGSMKEEYCALLNNNTWDLVAHPPGTNVFSGKWIFEHKFNADGTLELYKAH